MRIWNLSILIAIVLSSCSSIFEISENSRVDYLQPEPVSLNVNPNYFSEESSVPDQFASEEDYYTEEDLEYFDPNYDRMAQLSTPFQNNQSFNACNPYSSSLWVSPSIAYWNRQSNFGMGLGYGYNPYNSWYDPFWNPYNSRVYDPWYMNSGYGFRQASAYNPYYNQWMVPWQQEAQPQAVYQQRRNTNRRMTNRAAVPGRNIVPLQAPTKRSATRTQQVQEELPQQNINRMRIDNSSPAQPDRRGTSPNKVNRFKSPNQQPSRNNNSRQSTPSFSNPSFSSPSPRISSPSRGSSPNRSPSPSRRR